MDVLDKEYIKTLIQDLELNKEELDEHKQRFIESVSEFFYKHGYVSKSQKEWLEKYHEEMSRIVLQDDEVQDF